MNDLQEIIANLRNEISKYRHSNDYKGGGSITVYIVNALEIAIALTEIGVFRNRPISFEEEHWFKGAYQMNFEFEGSPWIHILTLYEKLVDKVKELNYFRDQPKLNEGVKTI